MSIPMINIIPPSRTPMMKLKGLSTLMILHRIQCFIPPTNIIRSSSGTAEDTTLVAVSKFTLTWSTAFWGDRSGYILSKTKSFLFPTSSSIS